MPTSRSRAFSPFDVVVVPFPYSDRLAQKRRPAIVVSASRLAEFGLVWLAMVTSADNRRWDGDVDVSDLTLAGLPAPSFVRPMKIATVDSHRVLQRIGRLAVKDARAVHSQLMHFLG